MSSKVHASTDESSLSVTNSESFSHSMRSKSPSTYESKRVGLTSFSMPAPNTNANLKQRLHSLEDAFDLQVQSNNAVDGQLSSLHSYVSALDSRVTDDMSDLKNKLEDDLAWMQKEFNHRFDLQSAENNRVEQSINALKRENKDLLDKLRKAEERIQTLESEILN